MEVDNLKKLAKAKQKGAVKRITTIVITKVEGKADNVEILVQKDGSKKQKKIFD